MSNADSPARLSGQSVTDCLVVGGGIMGLWTALKAADAGLHVTLADAGRLGAGASGGLLGALFPWQPERWTDKKQFQFDALTSLPAELAVLEGQTGLAAGHSRCGRLVPLTAPHLRAINEALAEGAAAVWRTAETGLAWRVADRSPCPDWLPDAAGQHGFALDTLAARIDPRRLTALLRTALEARARVTILEECAVTGIDPLARTARIGDAPCAWDHLVLASGVAAFGQLSGLLPDLAKPLGTGVKGQAALLAADVDPGLPVIFRDGLYIVAHEGGRVAVGSTSENAFAEALSTDGQLDALIAEARTLVPALKDAPVIERWAHLRPKASLRDPMAGPVPGLDHVHAMAGGFKISFGIAHRLAACVVAGMTGLPGPDLPASFATATHVGAAG